MTDDTVDPTDELSQLLERAGTLEPTAAQRAVARTLYGLFTALVHQGFSEEHALVIVTSTVQATALIE